MIKKPELGRAKRLFLLLQTITMLFLCGFLGFSGFLLWKEESARKEKRANLDRYYVEKIKWWFLAHYDILDGKCSSSGHEKSNDAIKKTESNMLKDGYDVAEIQQITFIAMDKADSWRKFLKQNEVAYAKEIERADREANRTLSGATKPTEKP